ncbi:MAG: M1 family aminopeptidase, partial [bacterium]|nr:M1 family aminopeptidase [bacterium]
YAQVTVQNFIYGGMENTTATVMNKRMLYDDHMGVTKTQQGLVAHELAHMWWGDMVTCAEWSHLWLNEGFATYFQQLYRGYHEGDDAFRYEVDERYRKTIAKDEKDARPIVVDFYNRKGSKNSANVYTKGQGVLHMLRFLVGDELFRETIRVYGEKHKYQVAETSDFMKVVRETTGENMDWFFEQWCYLAGHPKLRVTEYWDDDNNRLRITVAQTQEITRLTPLFRLPMDIEITCDEKTELHRVAIDEASQDFYFSLPSRPRMVIVDKGDWTLKTMDHEKSVKTLIYQAKHADTMSRINACRDLARKRPEAEIVETLRGIMMSNEFWGLRREAAIALGHVNTIESQAALMEGLGAEDARVRLAIAKGMGNLTTDKDVDRVLLDRLRNDYAYQVRAESVKSLVAMDSPQARKACLEALKQKSDYTDQVRVAGLRGLVALEATGNIEEVRRMAEQGNRRYVRHEAISAYAKLAAASDNPRDRKRAAKNLSAMLDDWYRKTRKATVAALDTLGEASAIPALEQLSRTDPVGSIRARAKKAIERLEAKQTGVASAEKMRSEIRRLSRQIETLQRDLEALRKGTSEENKTQFSRKEDGSN